MNRRTILKGIGALLAYAVIPSPLLATVEDRGNIDYVKLFQDALNEGVISGLDFNFTHPIRLEGIDDLLITKCTFNFDYDSKESAVQIENCDKLVIEHCSFRFSKMLDDRTWRRINNIGFKLSPVLKDLI